MEINKKPSQASAVFDVAKSYAHMSRIGQLYGRLNMIMDMKVFVADEELKVRKQIKETENNV